MGVLPKVKTKNELCELIEEVGFLPFFSGELHGFSVMDITSSLPWWSDDPERDPWSWRIQISSEHRIAYGKFFRGKAGFISREYLPIFANYRRDGYDFDSLYEEGKARRREKLIMDLYEKAGSAFAGYEIKRLVGFGKDGEKGFEGAITSLQMQTYLVISGFERKKNKKGESYGWPVSIYSAAEDVFGAELVRSAYGDDSRASFEKLVDRCAQYAVYSSDDEIKRFLK